MTGRLCRYPACGSGHSSRADQEVALKYLMDVLLSSARPHLLVAGTCVARPDSKVRLYLGHAEGQYYDWVASSACKNLPRTLTRRGWTPWRLIASVPSRERSSMARWIYLSLMVGHMNI